jgi:hypothetical protein
VVTGTAAPVIALAVVVSMLDITMEAFGIVEQAELSAACLPAMCSGFGLKLRLCRKGTLPLNSHPPPACGRQRTGYLISAQGLC